MRSNTTENQNGALLARETAECTYRGFWTYRARIVDEILARLDERYR